MPSESSHGKFLRFIKDVAQMSYFTPKMEGRYAFFAPVRSIFLSMAGINYFYG